MGSTKSQTSCPMLIIGIHKNCIPVRMEVFHTESSPTQAGIESHNVPLLSIQNDLDLNLKLIY